MSILGDYMLGIVLSGGGAKGAYEMGVWKALRKLNIKYNIVTGTSIGALNGMMMVQKDYYKCLRLWKNINYDVIYDNFDKVTNTKEMYLSYLNKVFEGGINTKKIEQLIESYYRPNKLYNSKIQFGVVAYNLSTKKAVYATKKNTNPDKLKKYVLASATCFPVFQPTKIDNDSLIDGGYYDNLPISLAIELGADEIIAVDLGSIGFLKKIKNKNVKITYIKPNNKLDSFLMFDSNVTPRMINLGYNDAMKAFKRLEGDLYTFKRGTISNLYYRYKRNIFKICDRIDYVGNFKDLYKSNEPLKRLKKILEDTLEIFEVPVDKIYSSISVNKELFLKFKKVETIKINKFEFEEIKKIFNSSVIVKYIYLKLKNHEKINPIFHLFPKEYAAAIYLLAVRKNMNFDYFE